MIQTQLNADAYNWMSSDHHIYYTSYLLYIYCTVSYILNENVDFIFYSIFYFLDFFLVTQANI